MPVGSRHGQRAAESYRAHRGGGARRAPDRRSRTPLIFADTLALALLGTGPESSPSGPLAAAGFDAAAPALVSWLGVTMYLTPGAVGQTLAAIGGFAPGTEVVADYMLPEEMRDEAGAVYGTLVTQASAERGEPWLSSFAPGEMTALARRSGFGRVRSVRQRDAMPARCGGGRTRCGQPAWQCSSTEP